MMPFNNRKAHMNNVRGNGTAIPNGPTPVPQHCLPSAAVNRQQIVQNGYVGIPQNASQVLPLPQHGPISNMAQNLNPMAFMQPQGQFLLPNYSQNMNQIMLGRCLHSQNLNQNMHLQSLGQFCAHGLAQNLTQTMGLPNGQFILQNQMQTINQIAAGHCLQHLMGHAHVTPFNTNPNSQPPFVCSNQIPHVPGSQNPNFFVNPQLAMANSIVNPNNVVVSNEPIKYNNQDPNIFTQPIMGQSTPEGSSAAAQQLGGRLLPSVAVGPTQALQSEKNIQPSGFKKQQVNDIQDGNNNALHINQGNATNKNFNRNHHGRGGFQKSQFHKMSNDKGKFTQTTSNRGKGNWKRGAGKPHLANLNKTAAIEFKRSLSVTYTEEEIQQWREERRKNFPSKANIEKKLAERNENSDVSNANAKMRRQQLKEILTKQAELGVEVAEIPPYYISDTENQVGKRENLKMEHNRKGRFRNKYDKRGHHGQDNGWAKKQKLEGNDPPQSSISKKTTLIEKLLSADIKRDRSHLLQVFRFIVMNSFFDGWPEKQLEFPRITVKDAGLGEGFLKCQGSQHEGDAAVSGLITNTVAETQHHPRDVIAEDDKDDHEDSDSNDNDDGYQEDSREEMVNGFVDGKDSIVEGIEKSDAEEGEITD